MSEGNDSEQLRAKRARAARLTTVETRGLNDDDRELRALPSTNPVLFGCPAGKWRGGNARDDGLPEGTPVRPLGFSDHSYWYISARGTLFELTENAGKGNLISLFTPYKNFPVWSHPRLVNTGTRAKPVWEVKGNFEAEDLKADLMAACANVGPYDPMKSVRGRGAWYDADTGSIILHLGDRVVTPEGERRCGVYNSKAYPLGPALPPPASTADLTAFERSDEGLPGQQVLEALQTWNWARGDVDARLTLGWIACAMVGGALDWRPYVFLQGDAGAGKSTLIKVTEAVLGGEEALLRPENATEAGVAQTLGVDSVPVLLDEAENEHDDARAEKLVRMARIAASGGQRLRGGADGNSTQTIIRACFMFAAIIMPTMSDQDMSRMAMLAMRPIDPGKRRAKGFDLAELSRAGRALHRQVLDWFKLDQDSGRPHFDRVLQTFRIALIEEADHSERGADTFGYLLAGFWIATELDDPTPTQVSELVKPLQRGSLIEYEDFKPGWRKCLDYILRVQPRSMERQRHLSAMSLLEAWRDGKSGDVYDAAETTRLTADQVNKQLRLVGLRVKFRREHKHDQSFKNAWLFVPNVSPPLAMAMQGTKYAPSTPDAPGGWKNALRGGDTGAGDSAIKADKIDHGMTRGTSIRLAEIMPEPDGSNSKKEVDHDE